MKAMSRLETINPRTATGPSKQVLEVAQAAWGMVPTLAQTMANSPVVLQAYVGFHEAMKRSSLSAQLRERIALAVSEVNQCTYCLASHTAIGKMLGLSYEDAIDSRRGYASDRKTTAALHFARQLVEERGQVADEDIQKLREEGYNDGEIAEITAVVSLTIFSNYFDHVAQPKLDFAAVPSLATLAAAS